MTSVSPMRQASRKVLAALSNNDDPLSAHDVADLTGLNAQTACRLLVRLRNDGFAVSDYGPKSNSGNSRRLIVYKLTLEGIIHAEQAKDAA